MKYQIYKEQGWETVKRLKPDPEPSYNGSYLLPTDNVSISINSGSS
mgnify:CR=1 FL=1